MHARSGRPRHGSLQDKAASQYGCIVIGRRSSRVQPRTMPEATNLDRSCSNASSRHGMGVTSACLNVRPRHEFQAARALGLSCHAPQHADTAHTHAHRKWEEGGMRRARCGEALLEGRGHCERRSCALRQPQMARLFVIVPMLCMHGLLLPACCCHHASRTSHLGHTRYARLNRTPRATRCARLLTSAASRHGSRGNSAVVASRAALGEELL